MNLVSFGHYLSRHFTSVFAVSIAIGLACPGLEHMPAHLISAGMAFQIFVSCFRISFGEVRRLPFARMAVFGVFRYLLLPCALFAAASLCIPGYAAAVLLFSLLPVGVSSPSFANIFNANVSMAMLAVVCCSLLSPFYIPAVFELAADQSVAVDSKALFQTLLLMIFCPLAAHLPLRPVVPVRRWINRYNPLLLILTMALTTALATARNRAYLLDRPERLLISALLSAFLFALFQVCGWVAGAKLDLKERKSFVIFSGVNNVLLGVVVALLHFGSETTAFLIAANLMWFAALIPFRWLFGQGAEPAE